MLFNYIYNLPNQTNGFDQIAIDTMASVNSFTPLLLAFVFLIIFIGGMVRQKNKTGDTDASTWAVVASLGMLIVGLILSTITGLINLLWLVVIIVITIFSGVWMFLDKQSGGV